MKSSILLFVYSLFLVSCGERYRSIGEHLITSQKNNILQEDTIVKDTVDNLYFSRLSSPKKYGMRSIYNVPSEAKNKELWVVVTGKCRTNNVFSTAGITLHSVSEDGQILSWNNIFLRAHFFEINKWSPFKDSAYFPKTFFDKPHHQIISFVFLGDSKNESVDIDTIKLTIKKRI